jgi:hypothetical protein
MHLARELSFEPQLFAFYPVNIRKGFATITAL